MSRSSDWLKPAAMMSTSPFFKAGNRLDRRYAGFISSFTPSSLANSRANS
ncbi:Uncharacterised protein [Vibrio cholerae]|nr:Uncharacterised protein [Vibrio cholerae]